MSETSEVRNCGWGDQPFADLADQEHARLLASAFCAANTEDELHAILRFHRRMTRVELFPYLDSCPVDCRDFGEMRDLAYAFLGE